MLRLLRISVLLFLALFLFASAALWIFCANWLPTQGKTLLIEHLERLAPIEVSIESLHYQPFQGAIFEDVTILDRATGEVWSDIPMMVGGIRWLPLLFQRQVAFHLDGRLETPATTNIILDGRYGLKRHDLTLDLTTADISLAQITGPLKRHVPANFQEGTTRFSLKLNKQPDWPLSVSGKITTERLVWISPSLKAIADLTLEGQATAPQQPDVPWAIKTWGMIQKGTLEGVSYIGPITDIEGKLRFENDHLDIETLKAKALDSLWDIQGSLGPLKQPLLELAVSSDISLKSVETLFPKANWDWHPEGPAHLQAACRGPANQISAWDCQVRAQLKQSRLTNARLTEPITHILGSVEYDHLTRQMNLRSIEGQLLGERFTTHGLISFWQKPSRLSLQFSGGVKLKALTPLLPKEGLIRQMDGLAEVDLALNGPLGSLQPTGNLQIRDASLGINGLDAPLEAIQGTLFVDKKRYRFEDVALRFKNEPLRVTADILTGPNTVLSTHIRLKEGELSLNGQIRPEEFVIEQGQIRLLRSQCTFRGVVHKKPDHPSRLNLSGTIELSDLDHLPFIPMPQLKTWQLQGSMDVQARYAGPLKPWQNAQIQGQMNAAKLIIRDIPVERVRCDITQSSRLLRLNVPAALVAEGRLTAETTIDHRQSEDYFRMQADLINMNLAGLTQTIPAWRRRQVSGTASSRAMVSGVWNKRSTWIGEGWLNASGEELGDLPLLDRLFRGLFGVLADRIGLETLRRAQITQASVQWQLERERLHTEQLRLGGLAASEPVAVYAKGSVGLDGTLDLIVEPELSERTVLEAPATSPLASTILRAAGQLERLRRFLGRHRLTGTLNEPQYRFEFTTQELFKQLAPGSEDFLGGLFESVR